MMMGFGGGCHWCTEAVFQPLAGVSEVRQGFIRSDNAHADWSEAVEVVFDPNAISLRDLISVHLITHASSSNHQMRGKYRSAVYAPDEPTCRYVADMIDELSQKTGTSFITQSLRHCGFKPSDARFHNYYRTNPDRPFCQAYITPKLSKLRARYGDLLQRHETLT